MAEEEIFRDAFAVTVTPWGEGKKKKRKRKAFNGVKVTLRENTIRIGVPGEWETKVGSVLF